MHQHHLLWAKCWISTVHYKYINWIIIQIRNITPFVLRIFTRLWMSSCFARHPRKELFCMWCPQTCFFLILPYLFLSNFVFFNLVTTERLKPCLLPTGNCSKMAHLYVQSQWGWLYLTAECQERGTQQQNGRTGRSLSEQDHTGHMWQPWESGDAMVNIMVIVTSPI